MNQTDEKYGGEQATRNWRMDFGDKDSEIKGKRSVEREIMREQGKTQAEEKGRE